MLLNVILRIFVRLLLMIGIGGISFTCVATPYAYIPNFTNVSVIDTATNTVVATITVGRYPKAAAVSHDGRRVYVLNLCASNTTSCTSNGTVSVIDVASEMVVATVPVGYSPSGIAISPNDKRVYVTNECAAHACAQHSISIIDTNSDSVIDTLYVSAVAEDVAVGPDGKRIYVTIGCASSTNCNQGALVVIDAMTKTKIAKIQVGNFPLGLAVSPDGRRIYVANNCSSSACSAGSGSVSVIDSAANKAVATIPVGYLTQDVAISPDGTTVYVANNCSGPSSCSGHGTVSVIDTATNYVLATVALSSQPLGLAISPDGSRLYVVDDGLSVIDTATDSVLTTVSVGANPMTRDGFLGPGALDALNSSVSAGAGLDISGTVPAVINTTSCTITHSVVEAPMKGNLTFLPATGAFSYTPTSATYSGPDAFTWLAQAPSSCSAADAPTKPTSNTATVSLTLDPTIAGLSDATIGINDSTEEAFNLIGSAPFTYSFASDNTTVLSSADLDVAPESCGADASHLTCRLSLTASKVPGTANVTVTARDAYRDTIEKTVRVTVAAPAPPALTNFTPVVVTAPSTGSETFTLTGTGSLTVSASSSNIDVLPNGNIGGANACSAAGNCTLTLTPAATQSGVATVTVAVTDEYGQSATGSFDFTVKASTDTGNSSNGGGGINTDTGTTSSSGGGGGLSDPLSMAFLFAALVLLRMRAANCTVSGAASEGDTE